MEKLAIYTEMREAVELELKHIIEDSIPTEFDGMRTMLAYHLGWEGEDAGPDAQGKRIRPLLVLLANIASGGEWRKALPAAASVELIHNFSLIHDDIQDHSPLRRGRKTVWIKWGTAQAINAGDLMFTLAFFAFHNLDPTIDQKIVLQAVNILCSTCVQLTGGQYLDLSYEQAKSLPKESYWPMVEGKTAALLAASCELGALIAGANSAQRKAFHDFGRQLGLAFQVQDDWLGIWGDTQQTGKSNESDLVSGKKTLPVIYALQNNGEFARRWLAGGITSDETLGLARLLEIEGAESYTRKLADQLTHDALESLDRAATVPAGRDLLEKMANSLLGRKN